MRKPRKRLLGVVAVVILTPPALWLGVVYLLPMGWARDRVVAALRESTRQEVCLDKVRLRPWGGFDLSGLTLASPGTPGDPWLKVADVSVDARLGDMIRGRVKLTACRASGVALRVHRDASGRLEFDGMSRRDAKAGPGGPSATPGDDPEFALSIDDAQVAIVDEPSGTRLDLGEVRARATIRQASVAVTDLTGTLNGGTFAASATLDRAEGHALAAQIHAQDVNLGVGMSSLAYVIPLLATEGKATHARGTLAIEVDLKARGDSSADLSRSLTGQGHLTLDNLTLDDSRILNEVQLLLPVPTRGKLGSLAGHFAITDRRVSTSDTILKVATVPIDLAGWSDFDGGLDYLVKCEKLGKAVTKLASRLPKEARDLLADLSIDDLSGLADVRVFGTIDHPQAKSVGVAAASPKLGVANPKTTAATPKPGAKKPALRSSDKAKLKEAAHRLLEKALR